MYTVAIAPSKLTEMIAVGKYDYDDFAHAVEEGVVPEEVFRATEIVEPAESVLELVHYERTTREGALDFIERFGEDAFGDELDTTRILADLGRRSLRPATFVELLAFGAKYPDLQRRFAIIAPGTIWQMGNGTLLAATLDSRADGTRGLTVSVCEPDSTWVEDLRFLAARMA